MDQFQGIVGEVRSAQELVQRAAQDEGEVGSSPQQLWRVQASGVHRLLVEVEAVSECLLESF